jgi:hypothetical protein
VPIIQLASVASQITGIIEPCFGRKGDGGQFFIGTSPAAPHRQHLADRGYGPSSRRSLLSFALASARRICQPHSPLTTLLAIGPLSTPEMRVIAVLLLGGPLAVLLVAFGISRITRANRTSHHRAPGSTSQ